MVRVLITGASGFLGTALTLHLQKAGCQVIPVSRTLKQGFLTLNDYSEVPDADIFIHLAEEPNRTKVNTLGLEYETHATSAIKNITRNFSGKIIYSSSAAVYGDQNIDPNTESSNTCRRDFYTRIKLKNEQLVTSCGGVAVRLSNLFGAGMSSANVFSDIIKQLPNEGPLIIRNASPIRDFLPVQEAVSAITLLTLQDCVGVFNIGSGKKTSIGQLAEQILRFSGQTNRKIVSTHWNEKLSVNFVDITKIKTQVGWYPSGPQENQLRELISACQI